jgi:hypothetical protein
MNYWSDDARKSAISAAPAKHALSARNAIAALMATISVAGATGGVTGLRH